MIRRWLYLNGVLPLATRWMVNMEPPKRRVCMDVGLHGSRALCDGEGFEARFTDRWASVTCDLCRARR